VRAWLLRAPWWAQALVLGLVFGGLRFLSQRFLIQDSWSDAAIIGTWSGALFGLLLGPFVAARNRRVREALGTDDPALVRRAAAAARGGAIPADPTLRQAAHRMALLQRDELVRQRRWGIPFFLLLTIFFAVGAVVLSPAFWLGAALVAVFLVAYVLLPRRLERRAVLLAGPADTAS
jgi:hypothetical protein